MALDVTGWRAEDMRLDLWVRGAQALFRRLRAGDSYTFEAGWDGDAFVVVDPVGTHVRITEGEGGDTHGPDLSLQTSGAELEDRAEWYMRAGFVFEDEQFDETGESRLLVAGPVRIWIREAPVSSPYVVASPEATGS